MQGKWPAGSQDHISFTREMTTAAGAWTSACAPQFFTKLPPFLCCSALLPTLLQEHRPPSSSCHPGDRRHFSPGKLFSSRIIIPSFSRQKKTHINSVLTADKNSLGKHPRAVKKISRAASPRLSVCLRTRFSKVCLLWS